MNVLVSPALAIICPFGLMEPPVPAEAVIVYVAGGFGWKSAEIVWLADIELKVYELLAPIEAPSIETSLM